MKSNLPNEIAWLIFTLMIVILMSACQPAVTSNASASPNSTIPSRTEPAPTQPPPEPTETQIEPTATAIPATHTPTTINVLNTDDPVCENGSRGVSSPATPPPQGGISTDMDSMFPPAPPAKVEAMYSTSMIVLTWGGTGTDVDQFYKVYGNVDGEECWQLIGILPIEGDNKGGYEFDILLPLQIEMHIFAITTVDIYGNESAQSIAEIID